MIELSKEKPYEDACKILGLRPVANYKSYKLTDETGLLSVASRNGLGNADALVGTSLEFKDRDTAKEFARICKPMIVKHLFGRDDHENFKFNF